MKKPRAHRKPGTGARRESPDAPRQSSDAGGSQMIAQRTQLSPAAHDSIPAVFLKSPTWQPLIYRKRIDRIERARAGDLVAVYGGPEQLLGYGLYNPRSELSVRMVWHRQMLPNDEDWTQRLRDADTLRRGVLRIPETTNAYRLVHAESDGLPGLVVDHFASVISAEAFSLAMYQRSAELMRRLAEITGAQHWMVRTSPQFLSQEGCDPPLLKSEGFPDQVVIQEFGTRFRIRFDEGHKTGFFCDQRENRRRLAEFCPGARVLDLCCYTGGFAVQASVLGKAADVTGVDLDEHPLQVARGNANLNQARVRFVQADAFSYMREMIRNGRQFDVVVLDPPKLIRTRLEIDEGTRKHFALNRLAMQLVRPGGLLLSCSCAGLLPDAEFTKLLVAASRYPAESPDGGDAPSRNQPPRTMQIIARTGAGPDHPVISSCPETEYLKAVWMIMN